MAGKGRPVLPTADVDTEWFKRRIRQRNATQRQLAEALEKDAGSVTRILRGERRIDLDAAVNLANFLREDLGEIARRLGCSYDGPKTIVAGAIRPDGAVTTITAKAGQTVPGFVGMPGDALAYVAEADTGPLGPYNHAVFYVQPAKGVSPDAFGRLCVVEAQGEVVPYLGTLEKSPQRGKVDLVIFGSQDRRQLAGVLRASIVLAVQFS